MGKIGFVTVGHKDYINETSAAMARNAIKSLETSGISIYHVELPAVDTISAQEAAKELLRQDVDGIVIFLGTWVECSVAIAVVREIEHLPMCLWGFPMFMDNGVFTSTGSYVSFAMFKGTMDRVQYRYKPILGLPDDPETLVSVMAFCKAAITAQRLKRFRIGLVGYTSMNIYPGTFDHVFMRVKIGPDIEHIDSYTLINMAEAIPEAECIEVIDYLKKTARIRNDVTHNDLIKVSKLCIAMKKLCSLKKMSGINVKCQSEFSKEYGMVMCVPLSALAEFGVVSSCEGDILNTVSMVMLNLLSGQIVTYGDVINHTGNVVKLSACGFMPFSLGDERGREIRKFLPHPGFKGIQNSFVMKPGRVTVLRLAEDQCDYHFVYLTGEGIETELRQGYMPALDVKLDGDIKRFVENYSGQHYAICYGDLSLEIEDLAKILNIRAIRV